MKALILAGGFGTRLRPLSCTRPKLMFPVVNRPVLDWTLENLARSGVKKAVLAVNYMADILERFFGNSRYGMEIAYSHETKPLGTGGPIRKAENLLKDDKEPFFVLNGDILSNIDYTKLYEAHMDYGGEVTIALHRVEDPGRFGVVEINEENQILRFFEKPRPEETISDLVNAGVYVLDQNVFEKIECGRKVSIEREIFPTLAKNRRLYGYRFNGLWVDIGQPDDYLTANRMMLDEVARLAPLVGKNTKISPKARIIPPSAIGDGVVIEEEAYIGPYAAIGEGTTVGKGSRIQNSMLFPRTWVDNFSSINGAIIGEGAIVGQWVKIEDQCILGDHAIIHDNVTLTQNVRICPSKEVETSILEARTVM